MILGQKKTQHIDPTFCDEVEILLQKAKERICLQRLANMNSNLSGFVSVEYRISSKTETWSQSKVPLSSLQGNKLSLLSATE